MSEYILDFIDEEVAKDIKKIESIVDLAQALYKKSSTLSFGNLDAFKPFIACGQCSEKYKI